MEEDVRTMQWADKHAPRSIDEMCLDPDLKERFKSMVSQGRLTNMTLYGIQGMGKTTLASLLIEALGDSCASIMVRCGIDNSVDMVRSRIVDFVDSYQPGKVKVVFLDEADSLSGTASGTEGNSAQKALRSVMCTDDCTFILTCNNLGQLSSAIQSRCVPVKLRFSPEEVLSRCVRILQEEKVAFTRDVIVDFYHKVLVPSMPDVRSIIRNLEIWCMDGTMKDTAGTKAMNDFDVMVDTILRKLREKVPPREISEYYVENSDAFNNSYEALAGGIFRKLYGNAPAQAVIAEYLFRMSTCYDKEIQFYAMLMNLADKVPGRV